MGFVTIFKEATDVNKRLKRLLWPGLWVFFFFMAAFSVAAALTRNYVLAGAEAAVTILVIVYYILCRNRRRKEIQNFVKTAFNGYEATAGADTPFPMVLIRLGDGCIIWANDRFSAITGYQDKYLEQSLDSVLPDCPTDWLASGKSEAPYDVTIDRRRYRIHGTTVRADDPDGTVLGMLYFSDLTELYQVRDEYIRSRPVVSIILIDNYEELTKNLTEGAIANLNAQLNNAITKWTEGYHGLLRKLEKNRFLFIFERRDLGRAIEDKFSLLEEVHSIQNPAGMEASVSIGVGVDGVNFDESYNFAALSIEMALSRGGDQAVIKDRFNFTFYGGRNKEDDHRSKVRSRVTANSLMELIGQSSQVFIMGHKNADLDAVGAAMGISCLCRKKGKKAYIVLDLEKNVAGKLIDEIRAVPEYSDVFITGQDAMLHCDSHSTLVVVDTNRPDQV